MVKKWQTLIEANVDVKTVDGYLLRVFCIGFTNKDQASQKKTCYAQHTQVKAIRKKMVDIITREVGTVDLKGAPTWYSLTLSTWMRGELELFAISFGSYLLCKIK